MLSLCASQRDQKPQDARSPDTRKCEHLSKAIRIRVARLIVLVHFGLQLPFLPVSKITFRHYRERNKTTSYGLAYFFFK